MKELKKGDIFKKTFGTSIKRFKVYDVNEDGYYCLVGKFIFWWGIFGKFYFTHEYLTYDRSFKKE